MLLFLLFSLNLALDNGLGLTPPMGWMAWEQYHCIIDCENDPTNCISEQLFVDMIDRVSEDGWLKAGYEYVNIDDCWMGPGRDENDDIYPDPERFPHGIEWLANYAHQKGVKLGIYNDYGSKTCGGYTGSEGYMLKDAQTFAKWGVDMLKMDGCNSANLDKADGYPAMHYFLNSTGRPILYSCSWPAYKQDMDYNLLPPHCNLWRNYGDISSKWSTIKAIINKWGNSSQWAPFAGPGHWNDPDQLMIGMTPNDWVVLITEAESRSQMSIWAIVAAPLIMSNDLRKIPDFAREVLMNEEVIAVDQDKLGKAGTRLSSPGDNATIWVRELSNKEYAAALFNEGETTLNITLNFSTFADSKQFYIRDLWARADLGVYNNQFVALGVPAHDTVMIRLKPN